MKKQSGFSLIELLLVLAIIGTISAIAIPAMLGQRARANDKAARANAASIMAELVASYDRLRDTGAPAGTGGALVGASAATALVPIFFSATNPWNAAQPAYAGWTGEAVVNAGAATAGAAATLGQVQLGYLAPAAGATGVIAASVPLRTGGNYTTSAYVE
jgi:prepilin-type N-terminal cleavage/methylation domain-containing protein